MIVRKLGLLRPHVRALIIRGRNSPSKSFHHAGIRGYSIRIDVEKLLIKHETI